MILFCIGHALRHNAASRYPSLTSQPCVAQLLALLGRMQLAAATGRRSCAEAELPAAAALLAALEKPACAGEGGPAEHPGAAEHPGVAQLRLHYCVLRALLLLAAGRTGELQAAGAIGWTPAS